MGAPGRKEVDTGFRQLWAARPAVQQAGEDVGEAGTDLDERREQSEWSGDKRPRFWDIPHSQNESGALVNLPCYYTMIARLCPKDPCP